MYVIPRTNIYYCFFFSSCKMKEKKQFPLSHFSVFLIFMKSVLLDFGAAFHCVDSHCYFVAFSYSYLAVFSRKLRRSSKFSKLPKVF